MTLLDTNILLRYASPADPAHAATRAAVAALLAAGHPLCIVPQTLYEFWATATRPASANGLGLTAAACRAEMSLLKVAFTLLDDRPTLFAEWEAVVTTYQCHGRVSYDARLVAAMRTHGITRILTFNGPDFHRYPGLTVLDPHAVAAPPPGPGPGTPAPPGAAP